MKNFKLKLLITPILFFIFLFVSENVYSQGPPPWAPAHGYRAKTKHIYFPDQNMYFDLEKKVYLYPDNGKWSVSVKIPTPYVSVNFNTARKVELDISSATPYRYNDTHVVKYKKQKKSKTKEVKFKKR